MFLTTAETIAILRSKPKLYRQYGVLNDFLLLVLLPWANFATVRMRKMKAVTSDT